MKVAAAAYELTKTGVVFRHAMSDAEYEALGRKLAAMTNAVQWGLGDWIAAGSGRGEWGNAYDLAQQLTGKTYDTLSQYARVSLAYSHNERDQHLPWTYYREALRLPAKERLRALQLTLANTWNRAGLTDYINTRLDARNALHQGEHTSGKLTRRVAAQRKWRKAGVAKRDVRCPSCGHVFDVRRRGLTETPIEPVPVVVQ